MRRFPARRSARWLVPAVALTLAAGAGPLHAQQPQDAAYTAAIREYTTEPFFLTPLVDYLPAAERAALRALLDE